MWEYFVRLFGIWVSSLGILPCPLRVIDHILSGDMLPLNILSVGDINTDNILKELSECYRLLCR